MSQSVAVLGSNVVPLTYKVPVPGSLTALSAAATFDGTAANAFKPCLSFYDSDGNLLARATATTVAAGASAEVSWFPAVIPIQDGIHYGVTGNVGDTLNVIADNGPIDLIDQDQGSGSQAQLDLTASTDVAHVHLVAEEFATSGATANLFMDAAEPTSEQIVLQLFGGAGFAAIVLTISQILSGGAIDLQAPTIVMSQLPILDPGFSGALWNNGGVVNVSP